jgi:hypothetical protein
MSAMSLSGCLVGRNIQNGGMLSDSKFQFLNPSPDTAHPVPETRGVNQGSTGCAVRPSSGWLGSAKIEEKPEQEALTIQKRT